MNWYRVTFKASSILHYQSAIIRMNIKANSPKDAIDRIGNNSLRVPLGYVFETWSVKAAYKLKNQERARFIPINQMNKDGSAPLRYIASWEWAY